MIHDAAIVIKHDDGRVELQQSRELAGGEGLVSGGAIGLLLGLALAVPVAGAVVGFAGGLGFAASGHAVLFALVGEVDWAKLTDGLAPYGGELVATEIADDVLPLLGATPPPAAA